jgi:ribonuclease HI
LMTVFAYTDGASRGNPGASGIGVIMRDENGAVIYSCSGYIGNATNNIAEYQALIACLQKARKMQCKKLVVHTDSQLMARQLQGKYRVKDKILKQHYTTVHQLLETASFDFEIVHIERDQNIEADRLANAGIDNKISIRI